MSLRLCLPLVAGALLLAQDAPSRVGELERLGEGGRDVMVIGLDAPGFNALRPTHRKFAYYLSRAAIAGNDILYFQNHRHAWDIKELFETLYLNRQQLEPEVAAAVEEYLKKVWTHHGQYAHYAQTKFVPRNLTFAQLQKAVSGLEKKKVKVAFRKGVTLAALKPHIFDPKVEPLLANQVPGVDVIKTSASGLYDPGLTQKAIEALPKEVQGQLNVRFDKQGAKAVPQVFKVGGTYGEALDHVVFWLKKALPYVDQELTEIEKDGQKKPRYVANPTQKKALEDLIAFFEKGEEARFKDHSIAWLKVKSTIDYLNGFHEVYKDPRGVIGSYQANVSFRTDAEVLDRLTQNALYFEGKMPWEDAWKRAKVEPPVAIVVNLLTATSDGGPISAAAYNLPNYSDIRRDHGSKNVMFKNVAEAQSADLKAKTIAALYLPADQELVSRHSATARTWLVYLHECIGHGSGQPAAGLTDPDTKLGPVYNALEECRADAVALYQFLDPKLVEIGAVSAADHRDAAKAMYLQQLTRALQAMGEAEGDILREAHDKGEAAILNWMIEPGQDRGVKMMAQDGKVFVAVEDLDKARAGMGALLAKLQGFKSTGDKAGAEAFFAQYGTKIVKAWQQDIAARLKAIGRPKDVAYVFPQLVPVVEEKGDRVTLKDVRLETKETFAEQMFRYKAWSKSRELLPK